MSKLRYSVCVAIIILALLSAFSVGASAAEEGSFGDAFTWSFSDDGTLAITGSGALPDFESYAHQPWRHIASSVKKVTFSEGITSVGANSFAMCPNLSSVYLPKSLKNVGDGAFQKCYSLKSVSIPTSVSGIGSCAFYDCWQLETVKIALASSRLTHIGDEAFAGCVALKTVNLPLRLTHIGEGAFSGCSSLDGIRLPDKLTTLGRFAFRDCTSLTSVNVPWHITDIPDYAFFGCSSLENVSFGRYLQSIGCEAFLWCPSLREIYFPAGVTGIPDYSVGYYYFKGEYVRYDGVTVISGSAAVMDYAARHGFQLIVDEASHVCEAPCPYCGLCTTECEFFSCYEKCEGHTFPITGAVTDAITWSLSEDFTLTLEGIGAMPDFTYKGVPWGEYKSCIKLAVIGEGITSVGSYAFDSHAALCEVQIPEGVTVIGRKAFGLCSSLTEAMLPDSVTHIGDYAFSGCSALERVSFGDGVAEIGDYSFYGCESLREAVLPEGTKSLGEGAFESCPMLKSFYVPWSVEKIGDFAIGYIYSADRHYFKNENFTLKAPLFSQGQLYAEKNGFAYTRTDTHICESSCEVCGRCLDGDCPYPECSRKCDGICTAAWEWPFTDVREGDWFADSVRYVYLKGLFTGITADTFAPNGKVTRAQFTVVLWRLAGSPDAEAEAEFQDLSEKWYREAVNWAYGAEVVTGKTATEFAPNGKVTREQMATMLMRFCKNILEIDVSLRGDIDSFPDAYKVSSYAAEAMSWALAEGLITGKNNEGTVNLAPSAMATRAECATILARLLKKI